MQKYTHVYICIYIYMETHIVYPQKTSLHSPSPNKHHGFYRSYTRHATVEERKLEHDHPTTPHRSKKQNTINHPSSFSCFSWPRSFWGARPGNADSTRLLHQAWRIPMVLGLENCQYDGPTFLMEMSCQIPQIYQAFILPTGRLLISPYKIPRNIQKNRRKSTKVLSIEPN